MERDALVSEIIELASACQTGCATDDDRARLERLLEDSEDARQFYLRMADDTVTLNDVRQSKLAAAEAARTAQETTSHERPAATTKPAARWMWVAAVAASVAALAGWNLLQSPRLLGLGGEGVGPTVAEAGSPSAGAPSATFARIVNLSDVQWSEGAWKPSAWARVGKGQSLKFESGSVEVLYDNGVQFVVQGPANCEFLSEGRVKAYAGKLVARVGPEAKGFQIVTPHAKVIDLGTSFGMTIEPDHQTDVVVYEGIVDLSLPADGDAAARRLGAGEAMSVGQDGKVGRISSVADGKFLPPPRLTDSQSDERPVLLSVTDNLKSSQTAKYYRVVSRGFREDCQAYVDRHHQWDGVDASGIPTFLNRGDYVMTFNDDKVQHELRIAVEVAQPARLYLLVDDRVEPPKWLTDSFEDTGWDIGLDEGYDDVPEVKTAVGAGKSIEWTCSVWVREVTAPSTVLLGSLQQEKTTTPPRELLRAMYGIVATPLSAAPPATD